MKWGAFFASEVFVLPSHQENFGIVVAEAMACGLPVILSDKVNIWREIVADSAGFVDKDTVAGTTASLRRWASLTAEERAEFRSHASQCFHQRFDFNQTAKLVLENVELLARRS